MAAASVPLPFVLLGCGVCLLQRLKGAPAGRAVATEHTATSSEGILCQPDISICDESPVIIAPVMKAPVIKHNGHSRSVPGVHSIIKLEQS